MATTETPTETLPIQAELDEVIKMLAACAQPLATISGRVSRVAKLDMDEDDRDEPARGPLPTFEEIGRFYCFEREARGQLEELSGYVANVEKKIDDLDYLRIIRTCKLNREGREAHTIGVT
jgi:hypothetical protein